MGHGHNDIRGPRHCVEQPFNSTSGQLWKIAGCDRNMGGGAAMKLLMMMQ